LFKYGGPKSIRFMQKLLKEVRKKEALLKDWKEAIILTVDVESAEKSQSKFLQYWLVFC
jgi:hypothetical protein